MIEPWVGRCLRSDKIVMVIEIVHADRGGPCLRTLEEGKIRERPIGSIIPVGLDSQTRRYEKPRPLRAGTRMTRPEQRTSLEDGSDT